MSGYGANNANEATSGGGYTYAYDNQGNLISETNQSTGQATSFTYDNRNQLISSTGPNGTATYTYDALGRRVGIDDNGSQTWTVYDGNTPYADFDVSDAVTQRYLSAPAVDELLARTSSGGVGATAWYLTDRQGSTTGLDFNNQTVDTITYDAFGNVSSESNPAQNERYKYTGAAFDSVSGLQYNNARYYDAVIGRWMSQDPSGFSAGDSNLYRYVGNSPTNGVDPSGLAGVFYGSDPGHDPNNSGGSSGSGGGGGGGGYGGGGGGYGGGGGGGGYGGGGGGYGGGGGATNPITAMYVPGPPTWTPPSPTQTVSGPTVQVPLSSAGGGGCSCSLGIAPVAPTPAPPTGDWLDQAANWFAGVGDAFSDGWTNTIRNRLGINDGIDPSSADYTSGRETVNSDPLLSQAAGTVQTVDGWGNDGIQVWRNTGTADYSTLDRIYASVGIVAADATGVRGINDAWTGYDAVDAHLQTAEENVVDGVSGCIQLGSLGYGGMQRFKSASHQGMLGERLQEIFCFTAGTPVATESGLKPIETIEAGERVWAYDHASRTWRLCVVEGRLEREYRGRMVTVSVGEDRIESTSDHPFWVIAGSNLAERPVPKHVPAEEPESLDPGRWVDAGDLLLGDELLTRDGRSLKIVSISVLDRTLPVYNLRVADLHTFCVGHAEVLVHNRDISPSGRYTEPKLPNRTIVNKNGVKIEHYTCGNDHPPAHAHVYGDGPSTRIGANGRPLIGDPPLSPQQRRVVESSLSTIRRDINKIKQWWKWSNHFANQ